VRRLEKRREQKAAYAKMTDMAVRGRIVFPEQVLVEMREARVGFKDPNGPDPPYDWACGQPDCCFENDYDIVQRVLERTGAIVAPSKTTPHDEADAYVLGLALPSRKRDAGSRSSPRSRRTSLPRWHSAPRAAFTACTVSTCTGSSSRTA
jgi:hypothetical protein